MQSKWVIVAGVTDRRAGVGSAGNDLHCAEVIQQIPVALKA